MQKKDNVTQEETIKQDPASNQNLDREYNPDDEIGENVSEELEEDEDDGEDEMMKGL